MKLISFIHQGRESFGVLTGDIILDVASCGEFGSMRAFIAAGLPIPERGSRVAMADIMLLPPIPDPRKIMCVGLNYRSHVREAGHPIPEKPTIFFRMANSQVGHGAALIRPVVSDQFDFEGELAVVIGRAGRHITEQAALDHVAGYACYNDGSVRDWQRHSTQWGPGKNFPQSGSFGPWIVTADEIPDPSLLQLTTRVNGDVMQHAPIDDLIFGVPKLISYCSTFTALEVGDVIVTGTTGGVGAARKPPQWLKQGDFVEVEISSVGTLANIVRDEPLP